MLINTYIFTIHNIYYNIYCVTYHVYHEITRISLFILLYIFNNSNMCIIYNICYLIIYAYIISIAFIYIYI